MLKKRLDTGKKQNTTETKIESSRLCGKEPGKNCTPEVNSTNNIIMPHQDVIGHNLNIVTIRNLNDYLSGNYDNDEEEKPPRGSSPYVPVRGPSPKELTRGPSPKELTGGPSPKLLWKWGKSPF